MGSIAFKFSLIVSIFALVVCGLMVTIEDASQSVSGQNISQKNTQTDRNENPADSVKQMGFSSHSARQATLAVVAFAILMAGTAWCCNRLVTRRIAAIASALRNVQATRSHVEIQSVHTGGNDEIDDLAEAFNLLARKLNAVYDNLEGVVSQRTTELSQTNKQLEISKEQALHLARQTKAADRAKSQFLANMSHEIRTPMNSIVGFAELLNLSRLDDEQQQCVDMMLDNSEILLRLIDDILDLSRIEAGKMEIEIEAFSLNELLNDIETVFRPQAEHKGLDFQIRPDGSLPTVMCSDEVRLRQCLVNLLQNAIKFTERGQVRLCISIQSFETSPQLCFDVEDTGMGITRELQKHIFDPFWQADGSSTRKYGGAGLGLTITRQIVELLGGTLSVQSSPGEFTRFSFSVPVEIEEPAPAKTS